MGKATTREVIVDLKKLPSYGLLTAKIQDVVNDSTWWERYGVDWVYAIAAMACLPASLVLLKKDSAFCQAMGILLMGCYHNIIANKSGHLAAHGAMAKSTAINKFFSRVCVEFVGSFPIWSAYDIHIKMHHPHTNIVGLGDSSTWKAPFFSAIPYMFFMPLIVPIITPVIGIVVLVQNRKWNELAQFLVIMPLGIIAHLYLLMTVSGFSLVGAILCLVAGREVFAIPYIHLNIFQHIGMPMYSNEHRPKRIYQMATGCLNISRNAVLDATFGHSLVNCHVEHHLFPRLSDNMCLKAKPLISEFLKSNGLPYMEDSYSNRLVMFLEQYNTLMVKAPPITHFVGIQ